MQLERGRVRNLFAGRALKPVFAPLVFSVLTGLFVLTAKTGCGPRPSVSQSQERQFQGMVVKVACPGEPTATLVDRYGRVWASQTGASVLVVPYDPDAGPVAEPPADLWVLAPAQMPRWANVDKLQPVPEALTDRNGSYAWQNILPLYRYKLTIWDQRVYALPLLGDALLCFYREDLFQDTMHRDAFRRTYGRELAAPATWEHFTEIAEYFHNQKRPSMSRPCPSLPPLPDSMEALDREFYSVAVPFARRAEREDDPKPPPSVEIFSFHYDLEKGAVRINAPGFVHALQLLQRLQAFRPAGISPEPPAAFQRGEAVLCLASPAWISRFQDSPALHNKFGICRVPGSGHVFDYATGREQPVAGGNWVPYLGAGGWLMVVPRGNAEPAASFALAAFLSGPKTSQDIVIEPAWAGGVFRREHLEGGLGWHQLGLDRKRTEHLLDLLRETILHAQVKNPVLRLRVPDEREHQQALVAELRVALLGGKDAGAALKAAAQRWREMDQRKDAKTRLREYRLSLSLSR